MRKRNILKFYLESNADMVKLKKDYQDSWLYQMGRPFEELKINGIASVAFNYSLIKEALAYAGYKNPSSDATWVTVNKVISEIIDENREYLNS